MSLEKYVEKFAMAFCEDMATKNMSDDDIADYLKIIDTLTQALLAVRGG